MNDVIDIDFVVNNLNITKSNCIIKKVNDKKTNILIKNKDNAYWESFLYQMFNDVFL